jgi:hypothetical protein
MPKAKPVLTLRFSTGKPIVKVGIAEPKQTAYPAEWLTDFRRNLPAQIAAYTPLTLCMNSGHHLLSVDRDGYCNLCGNQEGGVYADEI